MIVLYCRGHHGGGRELCDDCRELLDYATRRLDKCPLMAHKPTCAKCPIHCYERSKRERIKSVMRYAGPRMIFTHPILAILHSVDSAKTPSPPRREA